MTSRSDSSTASSTPSSALRPWMVVVLLGLLGSIVGALGLPGVLVIVALAYYGFCLVRPSAGIAWGFAALLLAIPQFQVAGIHIEPFEVLVWPASLIALASAIQQRHFLRAVDLRSLAPLLWAGGYMIIACVLLWGDTAPLEIRMWGSSLVFGIACYLNAAECDFQRNFPRAVAFSAVALCVLAVSQHYLGFPAYQGFEEPRDLFRLLVLGNSEPVRLANLTFDHFNSAGAYLSLVVGVLMGMALCTRRSAMLWTASLAAVLALYLTYSRGAALAATGAIITTFYLVIRTPWRVALVTVTCAIAVVAIVSLLPLLISSEYSTTLTLGARVMIWQAYLQAWLSSPFFGLGPGNGYATAQFLSPFGDEYAAHSNFLYLAADYGVTGLLAVVTGLGAVIVRVLRVDPVRRLAQPYLLGAVAVVTALAIHSIVDHTLVLFSYRVALFGVVAMGLRSPTRDTSTQG